MKLKSLLNYEGDDYRRPMTREETEMFMGASMISSDDPEPEKMIEGDPICQIISSRIAQTPVKADPVVILWVASLSSGRPGTGVMWAYTIVAIAEKIDSEIVTFDDLVNAFPWGFPTERAYRECWDSQKQSSDIKMGMTDNKLDTRSSWEIGAEQEKEEAKA